MCCIWIDLSGISLWNVTVDMCLHSVNVALPFSQMSCSLSKAQYNALHSNQERWGETDKQGWKEFKKTDNWKRECVCDRDLTVRELRITKFHKSKFRESRQTYERRKIEGQKEKSDGAKERNEKKSYQSPGPWVLLRWLNLWFHWKHQSHGNH